ncbi:spermatogenesis-associated protein 21 isoform X3 [Notamacropus eugenii]|uniref:spermatogenesis-associated protein 21 isoform X3 n=1 Tax=Notamacropus eugenii TaxID=9315 RepID=UPI003B671509
MYTDKYNTSQNTIMEEEADIIILRKDCFRSEKDRTEYISTSASASTTMSVQGCEVKVQSRSDKSSKGYHENQLPQGSKKTRGGGPSLKSGVRSAGPSGEEQGLGPGYKKTRGGSSGVKSGVESAGEEQGLGPGYKKTKCWGTSLKSGVENTSPNGEEQGMGHRFKKTRSGGSAVKSAVERAGPNGEEQGLKPGYKKTRGGGSTVKSAAESTGPRGEELGLGPGHKKTRGGNPVLKSGVESAGPSGEEGPGPIFWKTKREIPGLRSDVESAVPSGEEQVSDSRQMKKPEDQPFPDQQTEDKCELMEKELAGPDSMGRQETQSPQEVQGPQIIWTSSQKAEEDSEQFEDNTPDQSFQLRPEDEEGSPLLPIPLPMERPSSGCSYPLLSATSMQPEVGVQAPKAQLVQSPAVPPVHCPEKEDREEETDEDWKEEAESYVTWKLQTWGTTSWRSAMSLNLASNSAQASPLALAPNSPEKNWRKTELHRNLDKSNSKTRPMTASSIRRLEAPARPLSSHIYRKDSDSTPIASNSKEWKDSSLTQKEEEAFKEYFKFFCGPGEIDIHSLKNILSIVEIPRTQSEMADALISADVNGDGHVDFKDFLSVLTDTHRFYRSVEQNSSPLSNIRNPHTLFFEILSQLVEMLALPEASMEEITNYYQKKMKYMPKYKEHAVNATRQPHSYKRAFSRTSDIGAQEQKVLTIVDPIKQQNYSTFLQSPYTPQATTYPLYPRLDKKAARRRQGSHFILEEYNPVDLTTDFRTFFQMGSKGGRLAKRQEKNDSCWRG